MENFVYPWPRLNGVLTPRALWCDSLTPFCVRWWLPLPTVGWTTTNIGEGGISRLWICAKIAPASERLLLREPPVGTVLSLQAHSRLFCPEEREQCAASAAITEHASRADTSHREPVSQYSGLHFSRFARLRFRLLGIPGFASSSSLFGIGVAFPAVYGSPLSPQGAVPLRCVARPTRPLFLDWPTAFRSPCFSPKVGSLDFIPIMPARLRELA